MPHDVSSLQLSGMTELCARLRECGRGGGSMEDVARRVVGVLRDELIDGERGRPAACLARAFLTMRHRDLDDALRDAAREAGPGGALDDETCCLTLLATAGDEPDWNSRHASRGHRAIPLPDVDAVARIPMVSQLLTQLGLDVAAVVGSDESLILEAEQRTYNVFHVEEADGSQHIPAQDEFVRPYGVRSVVGFGGVLPTGSVFSVLLFSRVPIPRATADMFRNAAMNVKLALLPTCRGPVLEEAGP